VSVNQIWQTRHWATTLKRPLRLISYLGSLYPHFGQVRKLNTSDLVDTDEEEAAYLVSTSIAIADIYPEVLLASSDNRTHSANLYRSIRRPRGHEGSS